MLTREAIRRWPKTDLHCHLDGALRLSTLLELSEAHGVADELPARDLAGLERTLRAIDDSASLEEFLVWFKYTLAVMQTPEALQRIARELVEDAAADGVRYLEVRYAPAECRRKGLTLAQVNEAVLAGLREGEQATGTRARVIICALRDRLQGESVRQAELAVAHRDRGVVGFDLGGGEAGNPARDHAEAFRVAREGGVRLTCHAGEGDGPASIRDALDVCHAQRIGHGIRLGEDPALLARVVAQGIPLEVCPTSNVQTHVVKGFGVHPLPALVAAGVRATISTDNPLFSRTSVTEELWRCHQQMGLDEATLRQLVLNGFEAAFLGGDDREALLREVRPALEGAPLADA